MSSKNSGGSECRARLMAEFRQLEQMGRLQQGLFGVQSIDLLGEELLRWKVRLQLRDDHPLAAGLARYASALHDSSRRCLEVRVFFPEEYPAQPPEVMLHEPRLSPTLTAHLVSFNGKVHTPVLGLLWNPGHDGVKGVLADLVLRLAEARADVDDASRLIRPYFGKAEMQANCPLQAARIPAAGGFDREMKVLSASMARERHGDSCIGDVEHSDRLSLPAAFAETVYGENMALPLIFELRTQEDRVRHMGISDTCPFVDYLSKEFVIVPDWVYSELFVGHVDNPVRLRCVDLPAVKRLHLQPRSSSFYSAMERVQGSRAIGTATAEILSLALRDSKLTALTIHGGVRLKLPGGTVCMFEVLDAQPAGAVRLISGGEEIEFKVEFAPAPDHEDDEDRAQREAEARGRAAELQRAEDRRRSAAEQEAKEERLTRASMQRIKIEDETPNLGTVGDVGVKLKLPDGTTLDATFREGARIASIAAFVVLRSAWAADNAVLQERVKLATTFPRQVLDHNKEIRKRDLHRSQILVSEGDEQIIIQPVVERDLAVEDEASGGDGGGGEEEDGEYVCEDEDGNDEYDDDSDGGGDDGREDGAGSEEDDAGFAAVSPAQAPVEPPVPAAAEGLPRSTTDRLEQAWRNHHEATEQRSKEAAEAAVVPQSAPRGDEGGGQPTPDQQMAVATVCSLVQADPDTVQQVLASCGWDQDQAVALLMDMM